MKTEFTIIVLCFLDHLTDKYNNAKEINSDSMILLNYILIYNWYTYIFQLCEQVPPIPQFIPIL